MNVEMKPEIKEALKKIKFVDRYKELSGNFSSNLNDLNDRLEDYDIEKVNEIFIRLGYAATFDKKEKFFKQHGFVHARKAMYNAYKTFPKFMNKRVANIIQRHMFPLNIIPPRYKEGWVVTYVDKKVSLDVVINIKAIPKYLGLSKKLKVVKDKFKRK